jgi:hypothetical protein
MRRAVALISLFVLAGCGSRVVATSPSVTPRATAESGAAASASAAAASGNQDALLGPAGMTLQQEIGAVMMVGFAGPLTPAVLEDWRRHQFGGLIVVPVNSSAEDAAANHQLIEAIRGVMLHPLLAATNPEGASGQTQPTTTSRGLKAVGFDINFAPVTDVRDLAAFVADVHAAGMYAAAKPSTDVAALITAHAEFVVLGHLTVPSIAVPRNLGYQGVIISDDLQMDSLSPGEPPPTAAVRFLENGGDMVIVAHDITVANATYAAIHNAVLNGSYPRRQLDASVQKLLSLSLRYMP